MSGERERLLKENVGWSQKYAALDEVSTRQTAKIAEQQEKIESLVHRLFVVLNRMVGSTSERYVPEADPNQGRLFEAPEAVEPPAPADKADLPKPKRHPVRRRLEDIPEGIPVEEVYVDPEEDTSGYKVIGQEDSWYYDIVPAKVKVVKIIRRKYQDPEDPDRGVIMADLPPRLIDKRNVSEALLSHVLCAKFLDHMPLHEAGEMAQPAWCESVALHAGALECAGGLASWAGV